MKRPLLPPSPISWVTLGGRYVFRSYGLLLGLVFLIVQPCLAQSPSGPEFCRLVLERYPTIGALTFLTAFPANTTQARGRLQSASRVDESGTWQYEKTAADTARILITYDNSPASTYREEIRWTFTAPLAATLVTTTYVNNTLTTTTTAPFSLANRWGGASFTTLTTTGNAPSGTVFGSMSNSGLIYYGSSFTTLTSSSSLSATGTFSFNPAVFKGFPGTDYTPATNPAAPLPGRWYYEKMGINDGRLYFWYNSDPDYVEWFSFSFATFLRTDTSFNVQLTTENEVFTDMPILWNETFPWRRRAGYDQWIPSQPGVSYLQRFPTDDADGDGVSNLVEYYQGTAPGSATAVSRIEITGNGPLTARFRRAKNIAFTTGEILWSTNMTQWAKSGNTLGGIRVTLSSSVSSSAPDHEMVDVAATVNEGTPLTLFLRLQVTDTAPAYTGP